jgi:membrane-anchored mycosin MYCP
VPFVAGLVALVRSAYPDLSPVSVTQHIETTADRSGDSGPDLTHGWGVINPAAAVMREPASPSTSGSGSNLAGWGIGIALALGCGLLVLILTRRLR